jgi:magnesium-transporting ATPase (P-type)
MASNKKGEDPLANHVSGQANKPMSAPAHALSPEKVTEDLGANAETGLTAEEAKKRLEEFGNNEFGDSEGVQPIKIFIGQLANALTLVRKIPPQMLLLARMTQ